MIAVPATIAAGKARRASYSGMSSPRHLRNTSSLRSAPSFQSGGRLSRQKTLNRMNSIQDILPGSLPTQNIKKDAVLDKLCAGEVWQKRQCVLTNEVFVCAKLEPTTMGRPAIIDEIPLYVACLLPPSEIGLFAVRSSHGTAGCGRCS
eukprot:3261844-Rhodomonas_salina.2